MAIQNAINFLVDIDRDDALRGEFNQLQGKAVAERRTELGYTFTAHEFKETINLMHLKCQHEEQALHLFQLISWYKMIAAEV